MREIIVEATSLTKAADYLNKYADKLEKRSANILSELLNVGVEEAANNFGHYDTGQTLSSLHAETNGKEGYIRINQNYAVWIEFGTGVAANEGEAEHPMKETLGLAPWGAYGKGKGSNPSGWWYKDDAGEFHHTYGITATHFFYNTAQMLRRQYAKIAKGAYK